MILRFKFVLVLTLTLLQSYIGLSQTGSISGNVFWKYNDFVGNRPDAGSKINVYSVKDSLKMLSTIADVKGDFLFQNLDTGRYVVLIKSKATTDGPLEATMKLIHYGPILDEITNSYFANYKTAIRDSIQVKEAAYNDMTLVKKTKQKQISKAHADLMNLVVDYYGGISAHIMLKINLTVLEKISAQLLTVIAGQDQKLVVDFGNTYF